MTKPKDVTAEALAQILDVLKTNEPSQLLKRDLVKLRERVIELAQWGLGIASEPPDINTLIDSDYIKALRIVAGYKGKNNFLNDLKKSMAYYGGLTQNQVRAVLSPPDPDAVEQLRNAGVTQDFEYRWEAYDAARAARIMLRKTREAS